MGNELIERANRAVEMLMRLEDKPYFTGGRGPSPVHEIRSVIEALLHTQAESAKRIAELQEALRLAANSMDAGAERLEEAGDTSGAVGLADWANTTRTALNPFCE